MNTQLLKYISSALILSIYLPLGVSQNEPTIEHTKEKSDIYDFRSQSFEAIQNKLSREPNYINAIIESLKVDTGTVLSQTRNILKNLRVPNCIPISRKSSEK